MKRTQRFGREDTSEKRNKHEERGRENGGR